MATKKISELPLITTLSGSQVDGGSVLPVVVGGTTNQISVENFSRFATAYSATTASNTFSGNQNITGNVSITGVETVTGTLNVVGGGSVTGDFAIGGKLTVQELHTELTSASILFESGSTILGNTADDTHTVTGTILLNGQALGTGQLNAYTGSLLSQTTLLSTFTTSINLATASLNLQTGSQDLVNRRISSTTGSINTTTSSFDSVFQRISSTTGSINTTTSSFNSVFLGISSTTGSINTTTSSFNSVFLGISSVTGAMNTQSSSQNLVNLGISTYTGSQNIINSSVDSHILKQAIQTGSQDLVNLGISTYTGSQNVINTSVDSHILKQARQTGSQDLVNLAISTYTGSQNVINNSVDAHILGISTYTASATTTNTSIDAHILAQSRQTASQDLVNYQNSIVTSSFRNEIGGIEAYTSSLKSAIVVNGSNVRIIGELTASRIYTEYITSSVLFVTGSNIIGDQSTDKHEFTGSVHINDTLLIKGQAIGLGELNAFTGSQIGKDFTLSVVTSSIDAHILKQAIQTGSQDLVNLGISTYTGSQNVINTSVDAHILKQSIQTGSQNTINFNISVVTSSIDSHILKQATQTGSQDLVNLGISTFTGSLRSEVNLIEAYTASLKGAAIVSSSQQITNYYKFAETASANTFYGNQTFASSGGGGLRVYGGAGTHQWDVYLNGENLRISDNTAGDAALVVDTRASFTRPVTASALNLTKSPDGVFAELGGNTPKLNLYKFSSGNVMNIGHNYYYDGVAYGKNDISLQGWEFRSHITNGQYTISHSPAAVTTLNQLIKVDATTGDLTITNGNLVVANGKGIDFSATANSGSTTTSEILNDYEEGTWTATATYSGTNTPTHAYQTGHYTKIGRVVQIQALISWNENGSTGNLTITGLPYTANSTVGRAVTSMMNFGFSGLTTNLVGEVENSTTFIKIRKADNAGTIVTATDTDNDQDLYISCTYMV